MEAFFTWVGTMDQGTGIFIFFLVLLTVFTFGIFIIRAVLNLFSGIVKKIPEAKRANFLTRIFLIPFGGKVEEEEKKEEETPGTMNIPNSLSGQEFVYMVLKILTFKNDEKKLDKIFMVRSIRLVESTMRSDFNKVIRDMIYQSDPEFYSDDRELLNLITESIGGSINDHFKESIRENGLQTYTDVKKKKYYIEHKIFELLTKISENLTGVVIKMAKKEEKEFLSYLESSRFAGELKVIFSELLETLITFAIEREEEKKTVGKNLLEEFSKIEELSEQSISMIKTLLELK